MRIEKFTGQYRFLSNFYPLPMMLGGQIYETLEHAYQACKTEDADDRQRIRLCRRAGQAKRMGRTVKLRPDWENLKEVVMLCLLREKFDRGTVRDQLLATGDAELVEGNGWDDEFWGVCDGTCSKGPHRPRGRNQLGILLMQVRRELREQSQCP